MLIQPGVALKHAKEGTESSSFWFALGGKQNYTSKKTPTEVVRDPHLFTFSFNKGSIRNSYLIHGFDTNLCYVEWFSSVR